MKKFVLVALLAASAQFASAAPQASFGNQSAQSNIQLDPAEYNAYTAATSTQDPAQRAAALEAFLNTYTNSKVKKDVLEALITSYQQAQQPQKSIDAANRLLQIDSNNLRALVTIAGLDRYLAIQKNPPDQAMLDQAAAAAAKGLAAVKPMDVSGDEFQKEQKDFAPIFEDAKGVDEQNKKDFQAAIKDLTQALKDTPPDQVNQGNGLQDQFLLAQSYAASNQPLLAAYYFARVSAFAPQAADILKNAKYYYHKYHGKDDGFDQFQAMAKASLFPPDNLATLVTPAPSPTDIANNLVTTTPDLSTFGLADREFLLANSSPENADKVWAAMKGKTAEVPGIVISATPDTVQLAASDDAQQAKVADVTIKMAEPLKAVPPMGSQQTYIATFDSYTRPSGNQPFMIIMVDGQPKAKPAPAKRSPARRSPGH